MAGCLMVTSSFLPGRGGIESYLAELCSLLAPRVGVLAPGTRDGIPLPSDLGYPTYPLTRRFPLPDDRAVKDVIQRAAELGTDRVLIGTPWPFALLGPRLRRAGLRFAVVAHGAEMLTPAAVPYLNGKLAAALSQADLLLPVSRFTGDKMKDFLQSRGYEVPTMEVLRARVDVNRFQPVEDRSSLKSAIGWPARSKVILCFGRLVPRKGVHRLIEALPEISVRVPDVRLVIAGTGPEMKRLARLARPLGPRVVFTGPVPEADAPKVYAAADVFALAVSDRWFGLEIEGLGVVLLEAAASGTPAVTGRSGGTPEAVLDGRSGFVVDAGNRAELAGKIGEILANEELARSMGVEARAHIETSFSGQDLPRSLTEWLRVES